MPLIPVNGVRLHYLDDGDGEPVVMVMGTGGGARAWHLHQVPALTAAGYRTITLDNRGIAPSDECAEGFGVDDLVGDVAALIEALDVGPCRLVGTSMGAYVVQELALARPDLVSRAVLMATRGRGDEMRDALARAEAELYDSGAALPPSYLAAVRAAQNLSPRTLDDPQAVRDWLDVFEATPPAGPGVRAQLGLEPIPDRLAAYRAIAVPCHVIAFADDLLTPPHLGRELAATIPGATFELIGGCGHYGYLEDPEAVNKSVIEFLRAPV
ncbi:alpha/beta fold hydrolase [Actinomadura sp. NEAU-AAG7]|uniref:alpha/beta fold hydrolase n=1 Tax=Actinomadura sp. NEAU-AAG7 TaxID=2839640 RepID=UPI001BE3F686|nr:alpha/beta fold hydrolase [Actinomadura sp. NEAU-AAG7]MBT2209344.1 alpha/beta fold hydrolase [Actinomadura sp. NEAU-AAG7]